MAEKDSPASGQYTIILVGLLTGTGFYIADIAIDVYVFQSGTLLEEIFNPTYHETWMRASVFFIAVAFAIYVQYLLRREQKANERAITAERFLNSVIDNIPDMVFIKDARELRFVRVNQTGEKLLGLTTRELIGKNDYDFFPEQQAAFFTQKDNEVLKSGIEVNIPEEVIDTVNFGKRWLHTRKVPILDAKGQAIYLLGISQDITATKQAESAREKTEIRFKTLFNSAADLIFVIDPEGNILQTNRYACEHSGYEEHEVVGKNIKSFFTRESQDTCDCNFPGLKKLGYSRSEIDFVCKDGHLLPMECIASGVPDEKGNFTSFLIIQRDVTDKKQAEEKIQCMQQESAHVMRLSTMGEMASGMAHELNQPLTAIVSYCATAIKLAQDIPSVPEDYVDILGRASEQAHRAGEVIRHLREFVSKGGNNKTCICLDELIQGVIDFISWELRKKDIQIVFRPGAPAHDVLVGKVQIEQVIINLIRNSIEAIREADIHDGLVTISTRLSSDDAIEVSVTDNGPGIDPSISGLLFEPYQTSKETGMGMGLSISRSIVEAHNGKLWADVDRRNGALFGFNLPASSCVKHSCK